jgi:HAD superfamily hydrolase (TIGR01509 family)
MNQPRAVIFDLGKVLVDFDYSIAARNLLPRCTVNAGQLRDALNQSDLLHRYETGLLTTEQFFAEVQTETGFRGTLEEFAAGIADIFTPIEPMIDLHEQVRFCGVPVFIFSNTNELAIRHIRACFPFFSRFDGYVLSYEHGAMKPEAKLYEVVERMTGCRGAELFYLDDRPENVEAGAARGWRTVLHESPEKTRVAMAAAGLLA